MCSWFLEKLILEWNLGFVITLAIIVFSMPKFNFGFKLLSFL